MNNTLQLEDVDVWVWLKLIKPKKDSLVFLQKLTELLTVHGQWAHLAGTCWQQGLPMLLSTSVEKAFEWKCPHMETLLDELSQWLGTYMGVDPARALVNIEPYFLRKQSKVCYNASVQRVLDAHKGQKYTSLHIPTPTRPPGFWGSPSRSDDNLLLDGRGGGPPCLQARTDVPSTGPPTPSAPPPTSNHIAEDNPMEVNPADSLYYNNSIEVAVQSSLIAPVSIMLIPHQHKISQTSLRFGLWGGCKNVDSYCSIYATI
ncbi:hypothetical protein K439DRAFT_1617847 [Ramaria rubella]|nr:hypothetical protein K439DRAFT_1617847 [Ramaria rubella]